MYILTNVSQDEDGMVYAGIPTCFGTENEAIGSAKTQLAEDFGMEDIKDEAQEGGTPYVISMSRDGRFEAYTVAEMPDAASIKVETPAGTIIAEAKGEYGNYPGIWVFKDNNRPFNMLAAVEYNTADEGLRIEGYQAGVDEPRVLIDYETGDDLM